MNSCIKKRVCECGDSNKRYVAFQSYGPKKFSQKRCDDYREKKVAIPEYYCIIK